MTPTQQRWTAPSPVRLFFDKQSWNAREWSNSVGQSWPFCSEVCDENGVIGLQLLPEFRRRLPTRKPSSSYRTCVENSSTLAVQTIDLHRSKDYFSQIPFLAEPPKNACFKFSPQHKLMSGIFRFAATGNPGCDFFWRGTECCRSFVRPAKPIIGVAAASDAYCDIFTEKWAYCSSDFRDRKVFFQVSVLLQWRNGEVRCIPAEPSVSDRWAYFFTRNRNNEHLRLRKGQGCERNDSLWSA